MMKIVQMCFKALKIVGKVLGCVIKVITHAVQVHKAKKAAVATAAKAAQQKADATAAATKAHTQNIFKAIGAMVLTGVVVAIAWFALGDKKAA